jgi:hypothetical protein
VVLYFIKRRKTILSGLRRYDIRVINKSGPVAPTFLENGNGCRSEKYKEQQMSYHVTLKRPEQHLVQMLRAAGVYVRVIGWYNLSGWRGDRIPIRQFILPDGRVCRTIVESTNCCEPSGCAIWQDVEIAKPQRPL